MGPLGSNPWHAVQMQATAPHLAMPLLGMQRHTELVAWGRVYFVEKERRDAYPTEILR